MTFEETRERIVAINDELDRLDEERKQLTEELQRQCTHQLIIETPHQVNLWIADFPARKMCLICGLEEVKYGFGTKLARTPIKVIASRDEFYKYRRFRLLKQITVPEDLFEGDK